MAYIYALREQLNPKSNPEIRYIGQTFDTLEKRFQSHQSEARTEDKKNYKRNWLKSRMLNNIPVDIIEIEQINPSEQEKDEIDKLTDQYLELKSKIKLDQDNVELNQQYKIIQTQLEEHPFSKQIDQAEEYWIKYAKEVWGCKLVNGKYNSISRKFPYQSFMKNEKYSRKKNKTKRIILEFDENKNLIHEWRTSEDIKTTLKLPVTHILRCCKKHFGTAYGHFWRYKDECEKRNDPVLIKPIRGYNNNSVQRKKIKQFTTDFELIKEYNNADEAGQAMNCHRQNIYDACNGYMNTYKGYIWHYSDISDIIPQLQQPVDITSFYNFILSLGGKHIIDNEFVLNNIAVFFIDIGIRNKLPNFDPATRKISIYSDEWLNTNKQIIIKNYLESLSNNHKSKRIYHLKPVKINQDTALKFLNQNHYLSGNKISGSLYVGLMDKNNIIYAVGIFKKITEFEYEWNRYAFKLGFRSGIPAQKILEYAKNILGKDKIIISFSDNRLHTGKLYRSLGFACSSQVKPDYYYTNGIERKHKKNFRVKKGNDEVKTALRMGFWKIYDMGKTKWTLSERPIYTELQLKPMRPPKPKQDREIIQRNPDGVIIKKFSNLAEAVQTTNCPAALIRNACRIKKWLCYGFFWHYANEEWNKPVKAEGKTGGYESRKVLQFTMDNEFVCEYKDVKEAADKLGAKYYQSIVAVCGGRKLSWHGWKFKYDKERQRNKIVSVENITSGVITIYDSMSDAERALSIARVSIRKYYKKNKIWNNTYKFTIIEK